MRKYAKPGITPVKNPDISSTILPDGKWILLNGASEQVLVVSASAGIFWELCTGKDTIEQIIDEITQLYPEEPIEMIRKDVDDILPIYVKNNLVTTAETT